MRLLFVFLILATLTFGQTIVEPLRISITTDERHADNRAFTKQIRAELTRAGRVAIVSEESRQHFNLVLAAAPITESGPCRGFAAGVIVSGVASRDNLSMHVGGRLEAIAREVVEKLEEEYFRIDVNDDGRVGPKKQTMQEVGDGR